MMRRNHRSIHDISASTPFPSVFSPFSSYFLPFHSSVLHSLHVLFSVFFPISVLLLLLFTPYLTHNPPLLPPFLSILCVQPLFPSLRPLSMLHQSSFLISIY